MQWTQAAIVKTPKELLVAYLLLIFLGITGVHQIYLGRVARGVSYFFTFGWLTIGWWIDIFTLPRQVERANVLQQAGY